ncbi:hypothetical protein BH09BAC6_BH09BAC6_15000 [soil metagenome]|jgi:hypothetical protein
MESIVELLSGGDLRSIGKSNQVISLIHTQKDFDQIFNRLFDEDRLMVMRCADAIEKITRINRAYLAKHKTAIIKLGETAKNKELKWHLALLIPRLQLTAPELRSVWKLLYDWAADKINSRIVRVNAISALFELTKQDRELTNSFYGLITAVEKEKIPSINARIKSISKEIT